MKAESRYRLRAVSLKNFVRFFFPALLACLPLRAHENCPGDAEYFLTSSLSYEGATSMYTGTFHLIDGVTPRGTGKIVIEFHGDCVDSTRVSTLQIGGFSEGATLHLRLGEGEVLSDETDINTQDLTCMWRAPIELSKAIASVLTNGVWEELTFDLPVIAPQTFNDGKGFFISIGPQ